MKPALHDSQDGSHTIFSSKYNAHYHSVYGALEESIHVFIMAGLYYFHRKGKTNLCLLEMGFGSGLNAYLTLLESQRLNMHLQYQTLETDPIDLELVRQLNYPHLLSQSSRTSFEQLHEVSWNEPHQITDFFNFQKNLCQIEDFSAISGLDLIFYDAFAPSCQKHLWERSIHQKLYDTLNDGGILVTYCTNGAFKRTLKSIGYKLEILDGPGKKREMLRAVKV